jgi:hypothetical protein
VAVGRARRVLVDDEADELGEADVVDWQWAGIVEMNPWAEVACVKAG